MSEERPIKLAIGIYCSDQSHPNKRASLALFLPRGKEPWGEGWTKVPRGRGPKTNSIYTPDDMQTFIDPATNQIMPDVKEGDQVRLRYSLKCKLCGSNLTVRSETIEHLLDIAAEAGVSLIPLSVLVATVAR